MSHGPDFAASFDAGWAQVDIQSLTYRREAFRILTREPLSTVATLAGQS